MKCCTFVGHTNILFAERNLIKFKVKIEIEKLITTKNIRNFYNGWNGDFDKLCVSCIKDLKNDYPFLRSHLVLSRKLDEKNGLDVELYEKFDSAIYLDLKHDAKRFSTVKRNEWVINKSNFLIAYVNHNWGNAYKILKYAEKKTHIKIINIFSDK